MPTAYAQGGVYYLAMGLGNAELEDEVGAMLDDGSFASIALDDRDLYYELAVGMRLNKRFYLELGQQKLGNFTAEGSADGSAIYTAGNVTSDANVSLSSLSLQTKIIGNGAANGYLRLGVQRSKLQQKVSGYTSETYSGSGLLYGLGFGVIASRHWQLQLEMNRYQGLTYRHVLRDKEQQMTFRTLGVRALYLF